MQRFKGKFVLITGGTNVMGFATAQQFIYEGGKVIIRRICVDTTNFKSTIQSYCLKETVNKGLEKIC
jgi:NAD(P)-dependent dehydrogenase (short-subunit alcohol dehydrogenase family)